MAQIAIIGAGIGGLSAAICLAKHGHSVTICEALDRPGGKMGEISASGFRFDTGPSVITMRHVFEKLFREAGRRLDNYVDLIPLDPVTRYFWNDGLTLDATTDHELMCARIAEFCPKDVDGYRRFMTYAANLHATVAEPFLYRRQPGLRDLLALPLTDVFKIDAMRTMHQAVRAHFTDPHLIQLFDRFATYNGSSPYLAPATLNVISHVEMTMGAWYPRGGVYQLAVAMAALATELGVQIHYGAKAQEILLRAKTATGIRLTNGNEITAEAVIANADVSHTYRTLLPPNVAPRTELEPSCSGFAMLVGVSQQHESLAHHNMFFSDDYPREFKEIFTAGVAPAAPSIYVCITSKTDPAHAPAGAENWFVLVNAPHLSHRYDWSNTAAAYATAIKNQLIARLRLTPEAQLDLREPAFETHITPYQLQQCYGGNKGAIYGYSSNSRLAAFARPNNRAKRVKKLYFASGSAHPGGGVPLVTLSGMAAAECVLEDLR